MNVERGMWKKDLRAAEEDKILIKSGIYIVFSATAIPVLTRRCLRVSVLPTIFFAALRFTQDMPLRPPW
jgi:hypothetical protein